MLARPFASDTVTARDTPAGSSAPWLRTWPRVLTPGPERPPVRPAGARGSRRRDRWRSRRVPEGMAERVAGLLADDGEHEQARGPAVADDDLGLARIPVPLERDRVTSIVACVELHKHAWVLSGSAVASTGGAAGLDGLKRALLRRGSRPCQRLVLPLGSTSS